MEQVKKNRKIVRTMFTKSANDLEELLGGGIESLEVRVAFEMLNTMFEKLKALNEEIYEQMLNEDTECTNCSWRKMKVDHRELWKTRKLIVFLHFKVSTGVSCPPYNFRLFPATLNNCYHFGRPDINCNEDPDINCNDKVEYLVQATVPDSRARLLVESLKSRFDREYLQIEVYVRGLLQLIINNATSSNSMNVCSLYDGLETQICALETLGITTSGYSAVLFPLIESCLPQDLLRVWQRSFISSGNPAEFPDLLHFLRNEVNNEQRIVLAAHGFGLRGETSDSFQDSP